MNRLREDPAPPAEPALTAHVPHLSPGHHAGMRRRPPHEPIIPAYHPSPTERLGLAFRARRREIFVLGALIVALALGVVGTTLGMVRASRERDAALAARAEADRLRAAAEARGREAVAVSDFLEAVIESVNPWGPDRQSEVSVAQIIDVAAARLDAGALAGQKEGEARLRATLGHAYAGLGLRPRAEKQLRRSIELRREVKAGDHPELARALNALSSVLLSLGTGRAAEAEQLATAALEMRRRLWGPEHSEVADSLDTVSAVARVRRDYFTAERRVDEAIAMRRRLPPDDPKARTGLASSLTNRAILLWRKGELTGTIRDLHEAMENYRGQIPDDHLLFGSLHYRLGSAYAARGRWEDAVRHFRQSVEVRRRHRPESATDVTDPFRRLVVITWEQGDFAGAESLLNEREARLRAVTDCPAAPKTELYGHYVGLYQAWGKPQLAEPWSRRFRESITREIADVSALVDKDPKRARHYFDRAKLHVRAGQFEEASADYTRGLALDPSDHWPWYYHGCLLAYLGEEAAYREHCAAMLQRFGSSSDGHILDCTVKTCSLLPGADTDRLNQMANQVWALGGRDERNVGWFRLLKGIAELRVGSPDRAVVWLTDSLTPTLPHRAATAELFLAMSNHKLGKADAARDLLASAEQRVERNTPKPAVGDLAEGGIENWLICQTALREARAIVGR